MTLAVIKSFPMEVCTTANVMLTLDTDESYIVNIYTLVCDFYSHYCMISNHVIWILCDL